MPQYRCEHISHRLQHAKGQEQQTCSQAVTASMCCKMYAALTRSGPDLLPEGSQLANVLRDEHGNRHNYAVRIHLHACHEQH